MQKVIAVLGPTNTGKTHLAVERMLAHQSGMIGLPLRLLAREIYDAIIKLRPPSQIALITGEERIVPEHARYFVCTVEAMPGDLDVEFMAIDEVQLAADLERGYIFTERLLNRRGLSETMLLGADTMRPAIERLLPDTNFISRPRFSKLSYSGQKKITRLPPRTAIVAFSAEKVYAIAELIRRQRGGAAVVMGALSPRTRNAQVELYQSGDVDFLVATDAIGMGLNMDINHVAFAAAAKFDGTRQRGLKPAELAQIAGRAGRHMNDGTFGVTADASIDAETIRQIEDHMFQPEKVLQWRNNALDDSTLSNLLTSLNQPPTKPGLVRAPISYDVKALESLRTNRDIEDITRTPAAVRRLWEVCQLPDYRNLAQGEHTSLVGQIFHFLMSNSGVIADDWMSRQLAYTDRMEGDIDTLANRISHIRTWTYVANRADWLKTPQEWRERTRMIEDKLSDALHVRLTQRFIDRRTSVLAKRLRQKESLMSSRSEDGGIFAEDQYLGALTGFHFVPDTAPNGADTKLLRSAAFKIIARELENRAALFAKAEDKSFELTHSATITWMGEKVARLEPGENILKPRAILIADNQLSGPAREAVQNRLDQFVSSLVTRDLDPLVKLNSAKDITGLARGLAFRLVENFGILVRDKIAGEVGELDQDARKSLRKYGVRFGAYHIFIPTILKPASAKLAVILWMLKQRMDGVDIADLPELPSQGLTSVAFDRQTPNGFYKTIGFRICGKRCVRIDMLERLADLIRPRIFWKPDDQNTTRPEGSVAGGGFTIIPDMMSLVGCSGDEFGDILRNLGYTSQKRKVQKSAAETTQDVEANAIVANEGRSTIDVKENPLETSSNTEKPTDKINSQTRLNDAPGDEHKEHTTVTSDTDTIEVWLPAQKNTPRARTKQKHNKNKNAQPARQNRKTTGKPEKRTTRSAKPPSNRDIEASPFAALRVLRNSLEPSDKT